MKHFFSLSIIFIFSLLSLSVHAQRNCGTMENLEQQLQENPRMQYNMDRIEQFTKEYLQKSALEKNIDLVTIPVVVHVVYNRRSSDQNISEAQIQSQIDVLNEDFLRLNADRSQTPSVFTGEDTKIEFCLATVAPDGSTTNGITRTSTRKNSFSGDAVKFTSQGGKDAWPASNYLNVWVCNLGQGLLGYAQFPGGSASTDGVVCTYLAFGRGDYSLYSSYNLGRTMTHEVGHWLNLRHIWGDGNCNVDDFVDDTPRAGGPNYTGDPCTFPGPNSCDEGPGDLSDMFQNYMDYSDDACMNLFTPGQSSRMHALFGPGGARESLLSSNGCGSGTGGPVCDNGTCETGEDCATCPGDCGECPPATCDAPTGLTSSTFGSPSKPKARFSWNTVASATSYTVEWGEGSTLSNSTTTTGTSASTGSLTPGSTYSWQVTANCGGGETATSTQESFTARQADASGSRLTGTNELNVFPNPATNLLTIEYRLDNVEGERATILVNDLYGRVIQTLPVSAVQNYAEIDVSKLPNAVYVLRLVDGKGNITSVKKFLVSH